MSTASTCLCILCESRVFYCHTSVYLAATASEYVARSVLTMGTYIVLDPELLSGSNSGPSSKMMVRRDHLYCLGRSKPLLPYGSKETKGSGGFAFGSKAQDLG